MYTSRDDCFNWFALTVLVIATLGAFLIPAIIVPTLIRSSKEKNKR